MGRVVYTLCLEVMMNVGILSKHANIVDLNKLEAKVVCKFSRGFFTIYLFFARASHYSLNATT